MATDSRDASQYYSILFASPADRVEEDNLAAPDFLTDLNCDQIVDAITTGRDEYDLKPFFYASLSRVEAIEYRHNVMRELECGPLYQRVLSFTGKMREVHEHLAQAQKAFYVEQKHAWFLDAVEIYCDAVNSFAAELAAIDLRSRGFLAFRSQLRSYVRSASFDALLSQTKQLKADLAEIEYCVLIRGGGFTVRKYDAEADYSREVENTFAKFKQGAVKDYRVKFPGGTDINHIEAKILEFKQNLC